MYSRVGNTKLETSCFVYIDINRISPSQSAKQTRKKIRNTKKHEIFSRILAEFSSHILPLRSAFRQVILKQLSLFHLVQPLDLTDNLMHITVIYVSNYINFVINNF